MARGAGVDVVGVGVRQAALAQDDAHQVVRAEGQIAGLHRRGDLVVGLRDEIPQRAGLFGVTKRMERVDFSQSQDIRHAANA